MGFIDWHSKYTKKFTESSLNWIIFGKFLAILSLGAYFSIQLVQYGLWILLIAVIFTFLSMNKFFFDWYNKKKSSYGNILLGFSAAAFLILFLGIQSPQIPYSLWLIWIGLGIAAIAFFVGKK